MQIIISNIKIELCFCLCFCNSSRTKSSKFELDGADSTPIHALTFFFSFREHYWGIKKSNLYCNFKYYMYYMFYKKNIIFYKLVRPKYVKYLFQIKYSLTCVQV